tara:strand:+ start:3295 stop:3498 length:204 start_codon:yes stop_codon:yes gene_type:complete
MRNVSGFLAIIAQNFFLVLARFKFLFEVKESRLIYPYPSCSWGWSFNFSFALNLNPGQAILLYHIGK